MMIHNHHAYSLHYTCACVFDSQVNMVNDIRAFNIRTCKFWKLMCSQFINSDKITTFFYINLKLEFLKYIAFKIIRNVEICA